MLFKAVGVSFEIHDSFIRAKELKSLNTKPTDSSKIQTNDAKVEKLKLEIDYFSIEKLSFFKTFNYCYCYIGILTGPYFKYRTYSDWLNFKYGENIDYVRLMFKRGTTLPFIIAGYLILSQFVSFKVT